MRLLLDTHALLWWLGDDPRLGPTAREALGDPATDVLVSVVTLWEIALKKRVGKMKVDAEEVAAEARLEGFAILPITLGHLAALRDLPYHPDHRDPFDHLLLAQAIAEEAIFVSSDRHVARYPVALLPA